MCPKISGLLRRPYPDRGHVMNNGLFHLFLYATIILTAVTGAGIYYFLADRKKNRATIPTLGDHDRLAVLNQEIRRHRETLDMLIREREALSARVEGRVNEKPGRTDNPS
ncbi:hypothetical protein BOX30_01665 [Leptospirillum ferriphilum]|nr:hypothetical protein BOX30_01665 [Leptospirillum ferriphilum]